MCEMIGLPSSQPKSFNSKSRLGASCFRFEASTLIEIHRILHDTIQIAKAVNVTVIKLDDAPKGYVDFDKGTAKKFLLGLHLLLAA